MNPAVKRDNSFLNAALDAGVPITSEMNLFWKWNLAPIIAITGSNGKSTTTAMTHAILTELCAARGQRAWLGGNIGNSLLPNVDQISPHDLVVLELSSFQLADLDRLQVSPHVAVVTNFAANHLDWHPDLQDYRHSKQTILRWQTETDYAVLNQDDADVRHWQTQGHRLGFGLVNESTLGTFRDHSDAVLRTDDREVRMPLGEWLTLPGEHNFANAMAAITAATAIGAQTSEIQTAIRNYRSLPHRLEFVGEVNGRRFFNDSLATTPESTIVALRAFDRPIILLAGGYDKHVSLAEMAHEISLRAKAVALMGQTATDLHSMLQANCERRCLVSEPQSSFASAFEWAVQQSADGDIVLLSPGCASYDWFKNFADRGSQFAERVKQLRKADSLT